MFVTINKDNKVSNKMLDYIFNARSVAVIGASRKPGKLGYKILKNIIDADYKGKIYPINPKADEILGYKAYKSVLDVKEPIDLAVIVIPARFVPDTIRDCGKKGIKGAVIISGGFAEVGNKELEKELVRAVDETKVRVIGPNCQGINNPHIGLNASWPLVRAPGIISIASQSGTFFATIEMWAEEDKIGTSKSAAMGNKIDIDFDDLLEYYGNDKNTKVIVIYMEGVRNGRRFVEVAKEIAVEKPIVVLKGGRTEVGAKAVASHTRSLAGRDAIFSAAFKQSGIVRVSDLEELYDVAKAFATLVLPKGNNTLIITSSGGSGIMAADIASENGLSLPGIPQEAIKELREQLPDYVILHNPLDLTGNAYAELYKIVLLNTTIQKAFDSFIVIFGDPIEDAAEVIKEIMEKAEKPIATAYLGGGELQYKEIEKFRSFRLPVYSTAERAAKALAYITKYATFKKKIK